MIEALLLFQLVQERGWVLVYQLLMRSMFKFEANRFFLAEFLFCSMKLENGLKEHQITRLRYLTLLHLTLDATSLPV